MTTPNTRAALEPATLLVTEQAILTYAELTNDFNPLHLDSEFAAKTPMGRVIAHGTMSLCLLWQSIYRTFDATATPELKLDVRFLKPVFIGETMTAGGEPNAETPNRWHVWVRGQDGLDRIAGELRMG